MALPHRKSHQTSGAKPPSRARAKRAAPPTAPNQLIARARRKFLCAFPGGFRDETYVDWERDYKWKAHSRWQDSLSETTFRRLIRDRQFEDIARLASSIE